MATEGVIRRYTFKLYPNKAQTEALDRIRRLHCRLYNAALQERIDSYRAVDHARREVVCVRTWTTDEGEERGVYRPRHLSPASGTAPKALTYFDQGKSIKTIRADDPEYEALSADSLAFTLKRLDLAYQAFFQRAKAGAGGQSGFPQYKRSDEYPGFTHRPSQGWKFDIRPGARSGKTVFKGVPGAVKWRGEFPSFPYGIKTGDVMLRAGTWWLSVVADVPARMRADADHTGEVEFDLVDSFARVSRADSGHAAGPKETVFAAANGRITPVIAMGCQEAPTDALLLQGEHGLGNIRRARTSPADALLLQGEHGRSQPRPLAWDPADALLLQGEHGNRTGGHPAWPPADALLLQGGRGKRVKRGSNRDRKNKRLDAKRKARQARQRKEALHAWTTDIARQFGALTIISPPLKDATQSGKGNERAHGAEVELKAALNRRVLDQAPGFAIAMLEYKIAERGGHTDKVIREDAPAMIGNEIVQARKAVRKAERKSKRTGT